MPSVSFDSKSFLLPAGRGATTRFPIVGAAFDPALNDSAEWAGLLGGLRHAGFNTVVMRAPWVVHEPTPDRLVFSGACDLRRAITLAAAAGLRVMVRIGPCVGGSFLHGGLPGWLRRFTASRVREASPEFLARVTPFWRALSQQFVDLQATRNGQAGQRPVIAVGLEDDWRCLDAEVGHAYFGTLIRFARELGIEVPLFTANNCWYSHEGLIDAWSGAGDAVQTVEELRQVHPEASPLLIHEGARLARVVAESVAVRADMVCEVVGGRHREATSAVGCAERPPQDLFPLRRALVFASTFGEMLGGMSVEASRVGSDGATRVSLRGTSGERMDVAVGNRAGTSVALSVGGEMLPIAGARLERCTGSLVALLGDVVVVAGAPRSTISVTVDGSLVSLRVPAEGAAPKVTKVRGLRIATVTEAMAAGVGVAEDRIEFVFPTGEVRAGIARDGSLVRPGRGRAGPVRPRPVKLGTSICMIERGLEDGSHVRFARVSAPMSLGEFGVGSMHGYYAARAKTALRAGRELWLDARGVARTTRAALRPRGTVQVLEVRANAATRTGSHRDERMGVVGEALEVVALKGVKGSVVDLPRFDATTVGRFVWGYEARSDAGQRSTAQWVFAARTTPVVLELPEWWFEEGHAAAGHAFRLNGALLDAEFVGRRSVLLDGGLLSPMRPKRLAKGEKPPKAKALKLEPGSNELLVDLDPVQVLDARVLRRLLREVRLLEVKGAAAAEWSFARIGPPASWVAAVPLPRKPIGAPTWFRTTFVLDEPRALVLSCEHAAGSVATVIVNGDTVMTLDGASGAPSGTARRRRLTRTATISALLARAGENEVLVFEPDGVMPAITIRP